MKHRIEVRCSEERATIGTLEIEVQGRTKLTPQAIWAGFRPASSAYQLAPRAQSSGEYWRCPKCASVLTLPSARYEAPVGPRGHEAVYPLGTVTITREQARAAAANSIDHHEAVRGEGTADDPPVLLGVSMVVA